MKLNRCRICNKTKDEHTNEQIYNCMIKLENQGILFRKSLFIIKDKEIKWKLNAQIVENILNMK